MVGIAKRLETSGKIDPIKIKTRYDELLHIDDYITAISYGTSSERSVKFRCDKAIEVFKDT